MRRSELAKEKDPFLDKYTIITKIGEGSFSEVLKVRQIRTGDFFAAKKSTKAFATEDEAMKCPEVKATKHLDYHPNIIGFIDVLFYKSTGCLTLILELMDMSLYDFIKNRTRLLSENRCKNFLHQLVRGLHHMHKSGIFHRDIKPENILIKIMKGLKSDPTKGEIVKLADLGSVCDTYKKQPHSAYISTRWYRPPECLLTSGYYGAKMDVWALGCVFYEMLTLTPLFPGKNELDQLTKIHDVLGSPSERLLLRFRHKNVEYIFPKRKPVPFYDLVPMLSDDGVDVLSKSLAYHPEIRISVFRLYEHNYFDNFKIHKSPKTGSTPLLKLDDSSKSFSRSMDARDSGRTKLSSLSLCNPRNETRKFESTTFTTKSVSQNVGSSCIKKTEDTPQKKLERAWGMNDGKKKDNLLNNIRKSKFN